MLPAGFRIGDYELIRRVALGATSEVYRGRHVANGRTVAVKILQSEWRAHPEVMARFLNEGRALLRIRHARLITAFSCDTLLNGSPFIILEWLPIDLHRWLSRSGGQIPPEIAARITTQLAEVLSALHAEGIVHRDLKPANVLLQYAGSPAVEVKLADLGLAKGVAGCPATSTTIPEKSSAPLAVSTAGSALLGTWDYMAPEQWLTSKSVDSRADVYSLGALLFQMLTGRPPFVAQQQKDLMYFHLLEPPPLSLLDGLICSEDRDFVGAMLGKKPSQRPSMREVINQLPLLLTTCR
jgi:serine/threonine-protein kinase